MSGGVIPAKDKLTIRQGGTLSVTWTFYEDEAMTQPLNLTGWNGALKVKKDYDSAAILTLLPGATPPSTDGLVLGGAAGTVRAYVRDESTSALLHGQFTDEGSGRYTGVFDLELENTLGERDPYVKGSVLFVRQVTD